MKMDNKGWGLNTMIIMVSVIVFALLVATFFSIRLNNQMDKENNESENVLKDSLFNNYYISKINNMNSAINKYIRDKNITVSTTPTIVSLSVLISSGYISNVIDYVTANSCVGYSKVYLSEDGYKEVNSYLKCDNYVSEGYGES